MDPGQRCGIGAHLIGSIGQIGVNAGRMHAQKGVASMAVAKTALTAAALGVTAYSRRLGKKVSQQTDVLAASGTEPAPTTPDDVAAAQCQLAMLQWAVPAITAALVVISSFAGEQERASEVEKSVAGRFLG